MLDENLHVVGIDARLFHGRADNVARLACHILVERDAGSDQHQDASIAAPARAPEPLPEPGDGAWVTSADDRIEITDVDAELERVRGNDGEDVAFS